MNDGGVCRTAPATPGLLKMKFKNKLQQSWRKMLHLEVRINYLLFTVDCQLSNVYCRLSNVYCQLSSAHCLIKDGSKLEFPQPDP